MSASMGFIKYQKNSNKHSAIVEIASHEYLKIPFSSKIVFSKKSLKIEKL